MKLNLVPARTGLLWVKLGVQTFLRQPIALAGLFFMFFMVFMLLTAIPVLGPVASVVLMPGATLGMMAASQQAAEGRFPMPSVLLSAFRAGRKRARGMLVLGIVYAVLLISMVLLLSPLMEAGPAPAGTAADAAAVRVQPGVIVYLLLQLPFIVLFAHAPALVHWHGLPPLKSLFFSAVAFWRNLGAFVVFGVTWFALLMGVGLLMSFVFSLLGRPPAFEAMIPVVLVFMSIMSTSMYFTFRDSFQPPAADEETPPSPPEPPADGDTP